MGSSVLRQWLLQSLDKRCWTTTIKWKRISIAFNPVEEKFEVANNAILKSSKWIPDIAPVLEPALGDTSLLRALYTFCTPRRCSTASVFNLRFAASPTPEERISASLPCLQISVLLLPQETVCPVR